jgi:adenylate kinase family enzyme
MPFFLLLRRGGIFMRRVLILGSGGAGKTTFSKLLSAKTGLPLIHLDSFFRNPGWGESGKAEWRQKVQELCLQSEWIMDGNYSGTIDIRLKRSSPGR